MLLINDFTEVTQELDTLRARSELKQATFAGGCFWCMEGPFEAIAGVTAAVVEVLPYKNFFPAEDYHQQFYQKQAEYYARYKRGSGRQDYIEAMQRKFASQV